MSNEDEPQAQPNLFGDDDIDDEDDSRQENNDKPSEPDAAGGGSAEDQEEDIQLPAFRKRHADGDTPPPGERNNNGDGSARKKKKDGSSSGGSSQVKESDLSPEDEKTREREQRLQELERHFEEALKSGKTSNRRRRKDDEEDIDKELDESASRFVSKMRDAALADIDAKLSNKSALNKVRMLDNVKKQLNRSQMHNIFLDNGILEAIKLWLEPLQDSSLPSLDIIQDFLALLDILPIQTHQLVNSGVGRVVYFYTKVDDSRVTLTIKRQAHSLVDKWTRPIVKLSQDFRDKKIDYADDDRASMPNIRRRPEMKTRKAESSANSNEEPQTNIYSVRVPQIDRGSYALMPESMVTYDKSRGGKTDKFKKLKSHMTRMKQVKRT